MEAERRVGGNCKDLQAGDGGGTKAVLPQICKRHENSRCTFKIEHLLKDQIWGMRECASVSLSIKQG